MAVVSHELCLCHYEGVIHQINNYLWKSSAVNIVTMSRIFANFSIDPTYEVVKARTPQKNEKRYWEDGCLFVTQKKWIKADFVFYCLWFLWDRLSVKERKSVVQLIRKREQMELSQFYAYLKVSNTFVPSLKHFYFVYSQFLFFWLFHIRCLYSQVLLVYR